MHYRTRYLVGENTPGYLPESPAEPFDSWSEATDYADLLIEQLIELGYTMQGEEGNQNEWSETTLSPHWSETALNRVVWIHREDMHS